MGNNEVLGGGGFHHVAIKVKDFDATVKFYTEVLGFKQTALWGEGDGRGTMLDTGDGGCFEVFAGGPSEPKPEGAFYHLALRTTKCREVLERVRAAGMEITMEPTDIEIKSVPSIPATIAFFKGPDGEVVELFQNK
jgi:glyoxylase I family protein